jgi:hypothetical protein
MRGVRHLTRNVTSDTHSSSSDLSAHFIRYSNNDAPLQLTDADIDFPSCAPVMPPYLDAFEGQLSDGNDEENPLLGLRLEFTLPPRCAR